MILEKSLDYGRTWQPYQYYATDCLGCFSRWIPTVKDLSQHTVLEIICTEEYSTGYTTNSKIIHFEIKDRFAFFAGPWLRKYGFPLRTTGYNQETQRFLYSHRPEDKAFETRCRGNICRWATLGTLLLRNLRHKGARKVRKQLFGLNENGCFQRKGQFAGCAAVEWCLSLSIARFSQNTV